MPRRPSKSSFETEVEVNGVPTPVKVEFNYTPGHPGRLYGPPEDCEPPEGPEVEIERVYVLEDATKTDIEAQLSKKTLEQLSEQCCYEAEDHADDAYERAMEDKADSMREGD